MAPTFVGWLVIFMVGVARDVDSRKASTHQRAVRASIESYSPQLAFLISLEELTRAVNEIIRSREVANG